MKVIAALLVFAGCVVGDQREGVEEQAEESWGVYDPQPGHPTLDERDRFVAEIARYAQEAETTYGVPAAALTAIACNESGFGWTRIALHANNLYGFKYTTATAAAGRTFYTLVGQPDSDPGNRYIAFYDRRDAVMFVGAKLGTSTRYKPATDRYQADIAGGVDIKTAANRWIAGIAAAGYNPYAHYPTTTIGFMNNYRAPGATYSPQYNLYRYSPGTATPVWISIDTPAAYATVSGDVALATTTGGGSVTSVRFSTRMTGATQWYALSDDTSSPFAVRWATAGWTSNGLYEIRAEAFNGTNLMATGVIKVTVTN
jgi:hypothetical protein